VVDHNPLMREGLALLVGMRGDMLLAGTAATSEQAVALYLELRPEIVLLDLDLPGRTAFEAIRVIRSADPGARIIGIATFREDPVWADALTAGVHACAAKDDLSETLPQLILAGRRP